MIKLIFVVGWALPTLPLFSEKVAQNYIKELNERLLSLQDN
jgi:hypothetical protein